MSNKEKIRRKIASIVFRKGWKMYKTGCRWAYGFKMCLKVAWQIIRGKLFLRHTKVVGVTFDNSDGVNRQRILRKLSKIPKENIAVYLERESDNPVDPNAMKVIAKVSNKGSAVIGYLKKGMLDLSIPEVGFSKQTIAIFEGVTGIAYDKLGCNISYVVLDK